MARKAVLLAVSALAVTALFDVAACNYTDGPCYRREDIQNPSPNGAGGGPIVPGTGGYGDAPPPRPQSTDDPQPIDCDVEKPVKGDDKGDTSSSCGDIGSATVTEGQTYAYCSGQCEAKCQSIGAGAFSPSAFKFTTTVEDSGEGKAGGWQVTTAALTIVRWTGLLPERWTCTISVGMPLRTELKGTISVSTAATVTAAVATQASGTVMDQYPDIPQGIFCSRFKAEMSNVFASATYKGYGAKMMDP